jgi:nucleoside-diphosphate-sugar epimerase
MRRIAVTGSQGGTGRGIVQVLRDAGYEVLGIDRLPPDQGESGYVQMDLGDAAGVNDALSSVDALVHFGSVPGTDNMTTTEGFHNVAVGGFNLFQAATNVGIRRIVWASSIATYGDFRQLPQLPVTEESPLAPPGIYGASKVMLESLARDYCRWYGMSIAGFRLTRIIYDNDFGRAKLKRFVEDEGLGHDSLWSYIDARDVGIACQVWLESDHQGCEIFNVGADNVHGNTPTAELLQKHGYADRQVVRDNGEFQTLFSSQKLRSMLNWNHRFDWQRILDGTN